MRLVDKELLIMKGTSSSGSRIGNVFKSMKNQCHGMISCCHMLAIMLTITIYIDHYHLIIIILSSSSFYHLII